MGAVLGIDAAWTLGQPSGVALASGHADTWRLVAVAGSYQHFAAAADAELVPDPRPTGGRPDPAALLAAATTLCGEPIELVAIDMPLSHVPIVSRRSCDDAVSRAYGARKAGTHTPSAVRPGRISDDLRTSFAAAGYQLQTEDALRTPGLIEVYPHPALIELAAAPVRLPYKAQKVRAYWPLLSAGERRERLLRQWSEIVGLLDREIAGVAAALPPPEQSATAAKLKSYEDRLDAVVCAWVAICALSGRAAPLGDAEGAIWIPLRRA